MDLLNQTPFQFVPLAGRLHHPKHSLTIIVKGTFDLAHGERAVLAEQQGPIFGDDPYPDDETGAGGPRYESDLAHLKPKADLLLVGTCHAPGGTPTQICEVSFRVGGASRTLHVVGDRRWMPGVAGPTISEARRFTKMELRYERSFGGEGFKHNPTGIGFIDVPSEDAGGVGIRMLPNIEDPSAPITSPNDRPAPAGFGPLSRAWEHRASKVGTYGEAWFKTRSPWFPDDMDWSIFNGAPPPMQVPYLRGDEEIHLTNLHPEHAEFRSQLPGLRLRCFINTLHQRALDKLIPTKRLNAQPADAAAEVFGEIPMNLDTVWIDADAMQMVLVWRGHAETLSDEYEELRGLYMTTEPVDEPPRSLDECRTSYVEAAAALAGYEPAPEADVEAEVIDEADAGDVEEDPADAEIRAHMEAMGADPDGPAPPTPEQQAEFDRLTGGVDLNDEAAVDAKIAGSLSQIRMTRMNAGAISPMEMEMLKAEDEAAAQKAAKKEAERAKSEALTRMTRELVVQMVADGESLAGGNLSGLDLSGLDMHAVDLTGANLNGAVLKETNLTEATLTGANLSNADAAGVDLTKAEVSQANLWGANLTTAILNGITLKASDLTGANLTGAQMEAASLENAVLRQATLDEVAASGAVFADADLTDASLKRATLDKALLSRATLSEAEFGEASMCGAVMDGAVAIKVRMTGADLTGVLAYQSDFSNAVMQRIVAAESNWAQTVLDGADLTWADMPGSDFTKASMVGTNLYAADLKAACFRKANLTGARLEQVNLFQGNMEYANLTRADMSGANMYGVDFHDAVIADTRAAGTNLRKTQLHSG